MWAHDKTYIYTVEAMLHGEYSNVVYAAAAACVLLLVSKKLSALPMFILLALSAKVFVDAQNDVGSTEKGEETAARRAMFGDDEAALGRAGAAAPSSRRPDEEQQLADEERQPPDDEQQSAATNPYAMYSIEEQERRRSQLSFRQPPALRQTGEQRARTLNTMYKELIDSSKRGDPYLRPAGQSSSCKPMRR